MTDTLIDAGPLIAICDRGDKYHRDCVHILQQLDSSFYTTVAVLTEAMYIVGAQGGWAAQEALWKIVNRGDLILEHPTPGDLRRMAEIMSKHSDPSMDFADASLMALAERLSLPKIFTIDRADFSTYRLRGKTPFRIIGP